MGNDNVAVIDRIATTRTRFMKFAIQAAKQLELFKANNILPPELDDIAKDFRKCGNMVDRFNFLERGKKYIFDLAQDVPPMIEDITNRMNTCIANLGNPKNLNNDMYTMRDCFVQISDLLNSYKPEIDDISNAIKYSYQVAEDYRNGAEEQKIQDIYNKVGSVGHKPTIKECLTMTAENTDTETLIDRMMWMKVNSDRIQDAFEGDNEINGNIYIDTFTRLNEELLTAPAIKQAEVAAYLCRYQAALSDKAQDTYNKIAEKYPPSKESEFEIQKEFYYTDEFFNLRAAGRIIGNFKSTSYDNWFDLIQRMDSLEMVQLSNEQKNNQNSTSENQASQNRCFSERKSLNMSNFAGGDTIHSIEKVYRKEYNAKVRNGEAAVGVDVQMAEIFDAAKPKHRQSLAKSGFIIDETNKSLIKSFKKILDDKREASPSFEGMRKSVSDFLDVNADTVEKKEQYLKNLNAARKKVNDYLESHKSHRFSKKGQERVANALALKHDLEALSNSPAVKEYTSQIREARKKEAIDTLKAGLIALFDKDTDKHPANPREMIKSAMAEIMYQHILKKNNMGSAVPLEKDAKEIEKLKNSKAFNSLLAVTSTRTLLHTLNNPTDEGLDIFYDKIKENRYLDDLPKQIGDMIMSKTPDESAFQDKSNLFECPTASFSGELSERINGADHNEQCKQRTFLDSIVIAGLLSDKKDATTQEITEPGKNYEDILDKRALLYDKTKASREVIDLFCDKDKKQEFFNKSADNLINGMQKLLGYIDKKFDEMGEITPEKLLEPKNVCVFSAGFILTEMGQNLEKSGIKEAAVNQLGKNEFYSLLNKQCRFSTILGETSRSLNTMINTIANAETRSKGKVDIVGVEAYMMLGIKIACNELNRLRNENPGKKISEYILDKGTENADEPFTNLGLAINKLKDMPMSDKDKVALTQLNNSKDFCNFCSMILKDTFPNGVSAERVGDSMQINVQGVDKLVTTAKAMTVKQQSQAKANKAPEKTNILNQPQLNI